MPRLPVFLLAALTAGAALAQNVAMVNNKPITKATVDEFIKQIGQPDSPELRDRVKEELIQREVLMQEAVKRGIPERADVKFQIEFGRKAVIINTLLQDEVKKHPITEQQVQAEYDSEKAQRGEKEYHARHILVDKEDEAKEIIEELKKGAKFEDLAKKSKDAGSASRGGDLGWNGPNQFVKPFSDAMVKLEKGKFSEVPVQSQYGYHVILLEDVRETQFPSVDQRKAEITDRLQKKMVQAFIEDVRKKAKIQ